MGAQLGSMRRNQPLELVATRFSAYAQGLTFLGTSRP
jgi:hypothetical protein